MDNCPYVVGEETGPQEIMGGWCDVECTPPQVGDACVVRLDRLVVALSGLHVLLSHNLRLCGRHKSSGEKFLVLDIILYARPACRGQVSCPCSLVLGQGHEEDSLHGCPVACLFRPASLGLEMQVQALTMHSP